MAHDVTLSEYNQIIESILPIKLYHLVNFLESRSKDQGSVILNMDTVELYLNTSYEYKRLVVDLNILIL